MSGRPVAIVTGGGTGVGAATSLWLARRGHNVLVNYRSSGDEAAEVVERCRELGAEAEAVRGDVARDADCRRLAAAAAKRWGRIDVLVNNAGTTLFRPMEDLDALDAEDFLAIYRVNAIGPYQMARAAAPPMREKGGAIVNVSSIAGSHGGGSSHAYAASKGALNTLTLSLARALAPRTRVNAVLPGLITGRWLREGLGDEAYERTRKGYAAASALQGVATPEQVAEAVGWLATGASLMTGQLVTVDAGFTLGPPQGLVR